MDGVVASPQEAAAIREACGEGFLIVTPGIRPAGSDVNDQSRIATPSGALKNGSTHIVVGRPITKAEDKKAAAQSIAAEHGHFLLTSGLHSPMYVEKFNVLQHPKYTEMLCQELAERYAADNVELVIGPMTGGILLAHEVGKALGTRAIFTERENGKMTLKRGFQIPEGTRVLIVEDIVTTGGSVKEVLDVVKEHGGVPVGIGLLVDRSGGKVDFGMRTEALLHLDVPTYDPNDCPLCKEGKPFTKRGRTGK